MIAGEGIRGEIADEQRGKNIETKDGQNGAAAAMRDHDAPRSPKLVTAPLTGTLMLSKRFGQVWPGLAIMRSRVWHFCKLSRPIIHPRRDTLSARLVG